MTAPHGKGTRPTADRVRESLFNVLAPLVRDAAVLDLFAGSGALGIEALSRGAQRAVFVESDHAACRVLRKNITTLGLGKRAHVRQLAVAPALRQLGQAGEQFDLVLLDPPYGAGLAAPVLEQLADGDLLAEGAIVAAEHARQSELPEQVGADAAGLIRIRTLTYGDTAIALYRRPEPRRPDPAEEVDE